MKPDALDAAPRPLRPVSPFTAFRHRDFALFWTAALVHNSAAWMQQIAVPFVIYDLTRSATWLGFAGFASTFPSLFLAPVGGILADRYPRNRLLLATQSAQMLTALGLYALWASGHATPGRMVVIVALSGLAGGLQITSWQSYVPLLVPRESLANAVQLNTVQFTAARALGPTFGGFMLDWYGPGAVFLTNGLTFLAVLGALAAGRPRALPRAERPGFVRELREGLAYTLARRPLRIAVLSSLMVALAGHSIVHLAAGLASGVYGAGGGELGFMVAMFGVGSVASSIAITSVGHRVRRSRVAQTGVFVYAVGILTTAATRWLPMGLAGFALMGCAHVMVMIPMNTALQLQVDERLRGRVISLFMTALFVGLPIGTLLFGVLGDLLGLRVSVCAAGLTMAVYAVIALLGLRAFAAIDGDEDAL